MLSIGEWRTALIKAMEETASGTLECEAVQVVSDNGGCRAACGAYIPLFAESESLQVGLLSSREGSRQLAGTLLGMEMDDEELTDETVADAVGEIVNILGGVLQREVSDTVAVELGLPIFVEGTTVPTDGMESTVTTVGMNGIEAELAIYRGPPSVAEGA